MCFNVGNTLFRLWKQSVSIMETECFYKGNKVFRLWKQSGNKNEVGKKSLLNGEKALRFTETAPVERGGNGVLGTGECEGDSTG